MEGRDQLVDLSENGRIILKRILNIYDIRVRTGFVWLRWAAVNTVMYAAVF
jgi:hypothetical protein